MATNNIMGVRLLAAVLIIAYFILLEFPPAPVNSTNVPPGKKPCVVGDANRIIGSSSHHGSNSKKLAFASKRSNLLSPPPSPQGAISPHPQ
ncbi:hypothetical protein OROGR_010127 [Orobanche gracilis]